MTITKVLTPVAVVALTGLLAAPVHAGQYRGGGSRSRGAVVSRGGSRVIVGPRGYYGYRRPVFYRPYYSFRPRVSLGFGLWMGYPVPYPAYYGSPYGYAYPSVDPYAYAAPTPGYGYSQTPGYGYSQPYASPRQPSGYPPNGPASNYPERQSAPGIGTPRNAERSASGGISFEITPDSADVFVDGTYMGTAGAFGATSEPLALNAGRHHVEVRAPGYRTMTFDADVRVAEVIPYQGTLQRN